MDSSVCILATLINNIIPDVIPERLHIVKGMQIPCGDRLFLAWELSSLARSSGQGKLFTWKGRRLIGQVEFQN